MRNERNWKPKRAHQKALLPDGCCSRGGIPSCWTATFHVLEHTGWLPSKHSGNNSTKLPMISPQETQNDNRKGSPGSQTAKGKWQNHDPSHSIFSWTFQGQGHLVGSEMPDAMTYTWWGPDKCELRERTTCIVYLQKFLPLWGINHSPHKRKMS